MIPESAFRKSTYSGGGSSNCVEVALASRVIGVRDTKNRTRGTLAVSPTAWTAFLHAVRTR